MILWHELRFLGVDHDGRLWRLHRGTRADRCLGPIEDVPDVNRRLEGERAELLDLWRDCAHTDERAEWADTHRRQSGVFAAV